MKALIAAAFVLISTTASATTVRDLAWLTGSRVAANGAQEVWLDGADMLLGLGVFVKGGRTAEYEALRIGLTADGKLAFFATVGGVPPVTFPLKSYDHGKAVFENLAHDFPQRVIYWNAGNGAVGARIEGVVNGKPQSEEWLFKKR